MQTNCFEVVGAELVPGIPVSQASSSRYEFFVNFGAMALGTERFRVRVSVQEPHGSVQNGRLMRGISIIPRSSSQDFFVAFDTEKLSFGGEVRKGKGMRFLWPGGDDNGTLRPLWRVAKRGIPKGLHIRQVATYQMWALKQGDELFVADGESRVLVLRATPEEILLKSPSPAEMADYLLEKAATYSDCDNEKGLRWAVHCLETLSSEAPHDGEVARSLNAARGFKTRLWVSAVYQ